ncbi:MAG: hypothetical protein IH813_07415 [Thaumarchaeota archaeon]|nr:hypothetical protein [Nitrososphaerota archaeon]
MLIKMAIIGAILLGGGVVFANEINQFLPETSVNFLDSVKNDFGKTKDDTVQSAETRVEGTIVTLTNEVNNIQEKSSELLSKSAKEVIDSTQKGIKEITKTTQKTIFGGNGNNQNTNSNEEHEDGNSSPSPDNGSTVTQTDDENTISLETLSLKTTQQSDDGVMLQYEDTSGKTISVSVTLRTTERELFSGIFYSSMFETLVNDASNTAYFIDMVIEHQEYGTISSSVYNPRDSTNTIINGIFFQS